MRAPPIGPSRGRPTARLTLAIRASHACAPTWRASMRHLRVDFVAFRKETWWPAQSYAGETAFEGGALLSYPTGASHGSRRLGAHVRRDFRMPKRPMTSSLSITRQPFNSTRAETHGDGQ